MKGLASAGVESRVDKWQQEKALKATCILESGANEGKLMLIMYPYPFIAVESILGIFYEMAERKSNSAICRLIWKGKNVIFFCESDQWLAKN